MSEVNPRECSRCGRVGGRLYRYSRQDLCARCFVRRAWREGAAFLVDGSRVRVFSTGVMGSDEVVLTVGALRRFLGEALGRRMSVRDEIRAAMTAGEVLGW